MSFDYGRISDGNWLLGISIPVHDVDGIIEDHIVIGFGWWAIWIWLK